MDLASIDAEIFERFLQLAQEDDGAGLTTLPDQSRGLLESRRHLNAMDEADQIDKYGKALDRIELLNSVQSGFLDSLRDPCERDLTGDDDRKTWMVLEPAVRSALRLEEDILVLIRRGSVDTAHALLRTLLEVSLFAGVFAQYPDLTNEFMSYQARAELRTSAATFRPLVSNQNPYSAFAAEVLASSESEVRERSKQLERGGNLGWAHDRLLADDPEYQMEFKQGRRDRGPEISDLERVAKFPVVLRAVRAQGNAYVHVPFIQLFDEVATPDNQAMVALMATPNATFYCVAWMIAWAMTRVSYQGLPADKMFEHLEGLKAQAQGAIDRSLLPEDPRFNP